MDEFELTMEMFLVRCIAKFVDEADGEWTGTARDLFRDLAVWEGNAYGCFGNWPRSRTEEGGALKRVAEDLGRIGIQITFGRSDRVRLRRMVTEEEWVEFDDVSRFVSFVLRKAPPEDREGFLMRLRELQENWRKAYEDLIWLAYMTGEIECAPPMLRKATRKGRERQQMVKHFAGGRLWMDLLGPLYDRMMKGVPVNPDDSTFPLYAEPPRGTGKLDWG